MIQLFIHSPIVMAIQLNSYTPILEVMAWASNYVSLINVGVITYPLPHLIADLPSSYLKKGPKTTNIIGPFY